MAAKDISEELYSNIKKSFDAKYEKAELLGEPLHDVLDRIQNGTATFRDADMFAVEVGSMMSDSLKEHMILDEMPNSTLYRNIAQKTIGTGLKDTYGLVSNIASVIQEEMNNAVGIGIKAVKPKLEVDRVDSIVDRAVEAKSQEELDNVLTEPVETFSRQIVDDTQKANARLHDRAGLEVKVEREYDGVGLHDGTDVCDWCVQRAGTWTYDKAMAAGVFERHEGCGCIIDYSSKKGERTRSSGKFSGFSKIDNPTVIEQKIIENANKKAYTKINPSDIAPMDQKQFERIKNSLKKQGVEIIQDTDGDAFLKAMGAEAITLSDGSAVIFQSGRVPSASAVFEEIIHVSQIRRDGPITAVNNTKSAIEYLKREIHANEKLLRNKKAYNLTELDIKSVEENLSVHRKKLKKLENV